MSDEDEWNAFYQRNPPPSIPGGLAVFVRDPVLYIRCGLGRKDGAWAVPPGRPGDDYVPVSHPSNRPAGDYVPVAQWRPLRTAALATVHKEFEAGHLDGQEIGDAFLELVIRDPKVRACGVWLCLEREAFRPLFTEGKFPVAVQRRPSSRHWSPGPRYANVAYAAAKERFRRLPSATLSHSSGQSHPPWPDPAVLRNTWDDKWPVELAADRPSEIFSSTYDPQASYQTDPPEGPIHHAAKALAERHKAFFDLLRGRPPQVITDGTTAAGGCVPIDGAQWERPGTSVDMKRHDVWWEAPRALKHVPRKRNCPLRHRHVE